ncbi:MAG: hypothetical protein ABI459_08880 [Deltaproteobacteria bacterium]
MANVSIADQQQSFHERLKRIEKGARYTSQHVYCGPVEEVAALQSGGKTSASGPYQSSNFFVRAIKTVIIRLVAAPLAIAIGVAAVVAGRVLRVSFFGGTLTGENALQMFAYDLGFAAVIAFVLRLIFRFRGSFQWATFAALALSMVVMHNFVHTNPEMFATLFTMDWVQSVVAETREGTLLFAGQTVKF